MYTKWWEKEGKDPSQKCDQIDDKKKDSANELSLANVGGVFVVLAAGLGLSFFVALFEFIWKARQTSDDQVSDFIIRNNTYTSRKILKHVELKSKNLYLYLYLTVWNTCVCVFDCVYVFVEEDEKTV